MTRTRLLSSFAMLLLAGCSLGPDYKHPPTAAPTAEARGAFLRGDGTTLSTAPTGRWWEALGDPVLNRLVEDALTQAPDIRVTEARIAQARAGLAANKTALLPRIGSSFAAPYVTLPAGTLGIKDDGRIDSNSYSLGFDASWELDLFGGNHRRIESALATAEATEAGAASARVSLSSEVARAYVALRLRQAIIVMQEQQAGIDRRIVALARMRFSAGSTGSAPVVQAEMQQTQSESTLIRGGAEITVLIDQIAVLTGCEPGALDKQLQAPAPIPLPPSLVAVGDPAALLQNRPDIRAAERQLAAATATIGVKQAERFPQLSFEGLLGLGGPHIGDVVDPGSIVSVALPRLRWSLFDGGRVTADIHRAEAARDEAEASYRRTILGALQDAESALARFGAERSAYASALLSQERVAQAADLQARRAAGGTGSQWESLTAQRQALDAQLATASGRADLTAAFIAVEKALGLGWEDPAKAP